MNEIRDRHLLRLLRRNNNNHQDDEDKIDVIESDDDMTVAAFATAEQPLIKLLTSGVDRTA